jgi:2-dehydro-3-deoxyphosphooctonate aldolase (KDO 8-P synthase)
MKKIPFFIGPCVIESRDFAMRVAEKLKNDLAGFDNEIDFYFKASFDKANRSSGKSFRGPGIDEGLKIFEEIKNTFQVKTITDFHYPDQAEAVAKVCDVLQVPAFLCRQTDMIEAGALACKNYNRILKIKKGQFLAPSETKNIVDKAHEYLDFSQILLTERGTSFGYNTLVVDMSGIEVMKSFGVRVIHDATHCVQRPGGLGDKTGGMREAILPLLKASIAAGADGIFMEAHPNPSEAKSDAATQLDLSKVKDVVENVIKLKRFMESLKI